MTPDLRVLAENREALLLAEMAAWLHDMGKCADSFLKPNGVGFYANCMKTPRVNPHKAIFKIEELEKLPYWNKLSENRGRCSRLEEAKHETALWKTFDQLNNIDFDKLNEKINIKYLNYESTIKELILWGRPLVADKYPDFKKILGKSTELAAYLGRSHKAAHIEKEEEGEIQGNVKFLSSPFGYEKEKIHELNTKLENVLKGFNLSYKNSQNFIIFIKTLEKNFCLAAGDTRRPINEINLWDWSSIVAALFKAALAGALLGNKPKPENLKWRLLSIRFNSEVIVGNVSKIPVLIAREKWLTEGLDKVKTLLEKKYSLGNEVYRDENGSIFVVPDVADLLKIVDSGSSNKTLEELISEELGYDGEVVASLSISESWWGQKPSSSNNSLQDEIPPIAEMLKTILHSPPNPNTVKMWWKEAIEKTQNKRINNPEVCNISWIRPQGSSKKAFSKKVSDYWAEKVQKRAEKWVEKRDTTIWMDEVSDLNGRVCLFVGKFNLDEWLSPDGYIKTLLVKAPDNNLGNDFQKKPSFARIRRIWETTNTFWKDIKNDFKNTIGTINSRLRISGEFESITGTEFPREYNAYKAKINDHQFNIFYQKDNEYIIIENLQRLAKKMGADLQQWEKHENSIEYIKNCLSRCNDIKIYRSEGDQRKEPIGLVSNYKIKIDSISYIPSIVIFCEPSLFMALIPANKSLKLMEKIKKKYEKEMGKVRNRLSLILGMVFARAHTPLVALLDAGRKMLKNTIGEMKWVLDEDAKLNGTECILSFNNGITWRVPVKMGDGVTDDKWYPNFYVKNVPNNGSSAFKGPKGWLVHVKDLKKECEVSVTPSKFDFEFLDSSSRRFEVSYDENGNRNDITKSERPYFLEELDDFTKIWKILSEKLARSQIKHIIGIIETKRKEWLPEDKNDVFKNFIHDVLHNANWKGGIPVNVEFLENAAFTGKLKDIVEFYMNILKV